jgi:hypothetical protein
MHSTTSGNSALTTVGFNLYQLANFPLASPVSCTRPFGVNVNLKTSGNTPSEWSAAGSAYYQGLGTTISVPQNGATLQQFYDASSFSGTTYNSAVGGLQMNYPMTSPTQSAFFIFSGLAPQANFPTLDLAETGLICGLRSYMDGGLYTGINHITQLPLIQIFTPQPAEQEQGSFTVTWGQVVNTNSLWQKWGGSNYTEQYANGWTDPSNPTIVYNVKYNFGCSGSIADCPCYYVQDGTPAQLGVLNTSSTYLVTGNSLTFNLTGLGIQRGYVDVIVEAYRKATDTEGSGSVTAGTYYPLHYSWHAVQFYNFN